MWSASVSASAFVSTVSATDVYTIAAVVSVSVVPFLRAALGLVVTLFPAVPAVHLLSPCTAENWACFLMVLGTWPGQAANAMAEVPVWSISLPVFLWCVPFLI